MTKRKVFVAGATGELGRTTLAALVADGHEVTGVARTPEKAALVQRLGAMPVTVDLFDDAAVKDAVADHDTVVHVATKIPPTSKGWRKSAWAENDRLRSDATRVLIDAAQANGVETFIMESISFLYVDGGDRWIDEDTPFSDVGLQQSMVDAEAATAAFTAAGGRGIVLRFGLFYGPDAIHTKDMVRAAKLGIAGVMGDPAGYLSSIHVDDAGRAVAAALDVPAGTYNVVDDEPVTKSEFAAILGESLGRKRSPRTIGPVLTKMGGKGMGVLARSYRVSNRRFRDASGWEPRWTSVRDGLPVVVEEVLGNA
jgi:nucleoside-diphosphate-sugar epimerase